MVPVRTIFLKTFQYLGHQITLEELEDWLVPHLPRYLSMEPCSESELAGAIELGLAEMSAEQRTEDEFRATLQEFVKTHPALSPGKAP